MVRGDELVRRCAAGDGYGWEQLWRIVDGVASAPIRRLLCSYRIDPALADDLLQEFYLRLSRDGGGRLRDFRGTTEAQLRGYLRVLADRFARAWLARLRRDAAREAGAARARARAELDARPTEPQVLAALAGLVASLTAADRARLMALLGLGPDPEPGRGATDRTHRRWAARLARRLA